MNIYESSIFSFKYEEPGHYRINHSGVSHDVFIKKGSEQVIVFGQGAVDKRKVQPSFQRVSWVYDFEETIIIASDPNVNSSSLAIAWFQNGSDVNYFYWFSLLLKKLMLAMQCDSKPPIFYGSSAGGFVSLMMSSYFKDSWAVVNNSQTDWTGFIAERVRGVLNQLYDGISVQEYKNLNPLTYSPLELYKVKNTVPNIIYMQNRLDHSHYENHYLPFFAGLGEIKNRGEFISFLYDDSKSVHNPISKEETIYYIGIAKRYISLRTI